MAIVYQYSRFSSIKQEGNDSIRRQKAMADSWMLKHPEHTLDTTLRMSDLGVPAFRGANLDKGDLGKFIHLAKNNQIPKGSILLLERLDRFSRQATRKAYRVFCELVDCGITVQTLEPEQTIDETNIDEIEVVLPVIIYMQLAYEQSREKSKRCSAAWDRRKQRARDEHLAIHKRCPSWLFVDGQGKYQIKRDVVKAVRYIYKRTAQGIGQRLLVKELNSNFPFKRWSCSHVWDILRNRSVLGEFQPQKFDESHKRFCDGEAIQNYYPRVIDDALFYQVQAIKEQRHKQRGPSSKFVNLFTGLLYGKDGYAYHMTPKVNGKVYRRLTSFGHIRGLPDACPLSVDYFAVENAVLSLLYELRPEALAGKPDSDIDLVKFQNQLDGVASRLQDLEQQLTGSTKPIQQIVDAIATLETKRDAIQQQIEQGKRSQAVAETKPLDQVQDLLRNLETQTQDQKHNNLMRLRTLISSIVERIELEPIRIGRNQTGFRVVVKMKNAETRLLINVNGKTNYKTLGGYLR